MFYLPLSYRALWCWHGGGASQSRAKVWHLFYIACKTHTLWTTASTCNTVLLPFTEMSIWQRRTAFRHFYALECLSTWQSQTRLCLLLQAAPANCPNLHPRISCTVQYIRPCTRRHEDVGGVEVHLHALLTSTLQLGNLTSLPPPAKEYVSIQSPSDFPVALLNLTVPRLRALVLLIIVSCIPYILDTNPHPFYSFRGLKS